MALGILARRLGAAAWLLACVALLAGCAAPTPPRGSVHEGSVAFGTRVVPLPPGPWTVLSDEERRGQMADGPALTIRSIMLVQEKDGRATGIIRATVPDAYAQGVQYLPGRIAGCLNDGSNLRPAVVDVGQRHFDCRRIVMWARAAVAGPALPDDWKVLLDRQAANPAFLPEAAPAVIYSLADGTGQFHVEVIFNPENRGLLRDTRNWSQNSWNTGNRTPQHLAYIARLADWAEAAHPAMRTGLAGRTPPPLPPF